MAVTRSIQTREMRALIHWLQHQRERQGLTMRDLGGRLGVPHSYVQKVEQGERRLDAVEYVWYCQALGVAAQEGIELIREAATAPG